MYSVTVEGHQDSINEFEVYFNDFKITNVENAEIISSNEKILRFRVAFEKNQNKYVQKTVRMMLE